MGKLITYSKEGKVKSELNPPFLDSKIMKFLFFVQASLRNHKLRIHSVKKYSIKYLKRKSILPDY